MTCAPNALCSGASGRRLASHQIKNSSPPSKFYCLPLEQNKSWLVFNWLSSSLSSPPPSPSPRSLFCLPALWSVCILSFHLLWLTPPLSALLFCSGVRPVYTNNRVPVLQRCGAQREPLSPAPGAQDGGRQAMRESEDALCMPPTLTPSKGFLEEKVGPGFGPTRKRPLIVKAEQDDSQDGDRESHPEKRVKLSAGENLINKPPPPLFPPAL